MVDVACSSSAACTAIGVDSFGASGAVVSPSVGGIVVVVALAGEDVAVVVVGDPATVVVGVPGAVVLVGEPGTVVVGVPGAVVVVGAPGTVVVVVVGVPGTVVEVVVGIPGMVVVTGVVVVVGDTMSAATSIASMWRYPVTPVPDPRNRTTVLDPMYPLISNDALDAFCGPARLIVVSVVHDDPPVPETCTVTLPGTWPCVCRR